MTLSVTSYLGLQLAVPATKEPFNTGIYNSNLTKIENKLQAVDGAAGAAQSTANNAYGLASTANGAAGNAQNSANDGINRANNAQGTANNAASDASYAHGRADDAWNRTQDLYNRTGGSFRHIAGAITPSAANTRTSQHVSWGDYGFKPVAVVTPETGVPDSVRMSLNNISSNGADVVIYRSDTTTTGFNIIVLG